MQKFTWSIAAAAHMLESGVQGYFRHESHKLEQRKGEPEPLRRLAHYSGTWMCSTGPLSVSSCLIMSVTIRKARSSCG